MTDLADFLLARIAEDEAAAGRADADRIRQAVHNSLGCLVGDVVFVARHDPGRVLAECEAKRRIVAEHPIYRGPRILTVDSSTTDYGCELCHCIDPVRTDGIIEANGYCETLLALAPPYVNHPDYREDWRP